MERLIKVDTIKPKCSKDIKASRLGLGFEKLDRDVFDPENAYDKVAELGVKWIRLQSGWAKTEKVKGVYDFEWLDKIVDNLISRGLLPWMCLCYGNGLYTDEANKYFGAVGCPPIHTEEEKIVNILSSDKRFANESYSNVTINWYGIGQTVGKQPELKEWKKSFILKQHKK